jgi:hypothetical protein
MRLEQKLFRLAREVVTKILSSATDAVTEDIQEAIGAFNNKKSIRY